MSSSDVTQVTAVHAPGTDLATIGGGQVEGYRARMVMTPEDAKALDQQVRAVTKAVLVKDTDYGVIPGTGGRQVLFKPGAEKLLQWFGFGFMIDRVEIDYDSDGRKEGVTYRATITKGIDGRLVHIATCEGYAGYDEDRFYQPVSDEAKVKAEKRERAYAAKDKRPANPNKWKLLGDYKAPWNTVIKMAQKRALVGATIDATAAAGLFTADDTPVEFTDDPRAARNEPDGGWPEGAAAPRPAADAEPWIKGALKRAAAVATQAQGDALWREAADAARNGLCTPRQADHVQNLAVKRVTEQRIKARDAALNLLSENDEWREKVIDLTDDHQAREALDEIRQLTAAGKLDQVRAGRISRAIADRFPKAAIPDPDATA